jgi:ribonuclease HI
MTENALNIYTDGSSLPKPRKGGMGIVYIYIDSLGNETIKEFPVTGYKGATNNQMELNACVIALKNIPDFGPDISYKNIYIYTDSQYVVSNYMNAMFLWPTTKWTRSGGAPVLNAEQWKDLIRVVKTIRKKIEIKKVKGHSVDPYNKRVDKMAKESAKKADKKPLVQTKLRRKISKEKTKVGSVEIKGQRIQLRIIGSEYLSVQKTFRYRYEVISKLSPYYGCVDFLCSDENVNPGHSYYVKLNNEKSNPKIIKVYREIE